MPLKDLLSRERIAVLDQPLDSAAVLDAAARLLSLDKPGDAAPIAACLLQRERLGSTAIQSMIRRLVDAEDPRKPLSDARLADTLKAGGVPVARRTVAKYREAMNIPPSQQRMRPA